MTHNTNQPPFPVTRMRRLRQNEALRKMFSETTLTKNDFIYPLFVVEGKSVKKEIGSMPGIYQLSLENAVKECEDTMKLGIPAIILFGIPDHKDELGTEAYAENG